MTAFQAHGVAPGTTIGHAAATVPSGDGGVPKSPCPQLTQQGQNNLNVCPFPNSELSSIQGRALVEIVGGQTIKRFQQTIGDSMEDVCNGDSVTEASGYAGTRLLCYNPGAPFSPTSTVRGVLGTSAKIRASLSTARTSGGMTTTATPRVL